jgi:hypothetical protein
MTVLFCIVTTFGPAMVDRKPRARFLLPAEEVTVESSHKIVAILVCGELKALRIARFSFRWRWCVELTDSGPEGE